MEVKYSIKYKIWYYSPFKEIFFSGLVVLLTYYYTNPRFNQLDISSERYKYTQLGNILSNKDILKDSFKRKPRGKHASSGASAADNGGTKDNGGPLNNKIAKIISAILGALMVAFSIFGAYYYTKTDNALSKIPRADIMPSDNTTVDPDSTASESPKPSPTTSAITDKLKKVNPTAKSTYTSNGNNSNNGATSGHTPVETHTYHAPSTTTTGNGGGGNGGGEDDDSGVAPKHYSKSATNVNGVSSVVDTIKHAKLPKGVKTYLLMGSDSRNIRADRGRSDSLMLVYVNSNRKNVYLLSFPRDLYVKIPGYAKQKINAAYNKGGAPLTVRTIESFTGVDVQHDAIVNFNSFVGLVDSVGGVTIYNPYQGCDNHQHLCWKKGNLKLNSWDALHYVRWRHGLPNGDVDRARNQEKVVKAIIAKTLTPSNLADPNKLSKIIENSGKFIVVDKGLTNDKIRSDAFDMRVSSGDNIRTLTAPIVGYYMDPIYGSVDLVNAKMMNELRKALQSGNLDNYYAKYHNAPVSGPATQYSMNNW